jgi:hypothetical protein
VLTVFVALVTAEYNVVNRVLDMVASLLARAPRR